MHVRTENFFRIVHSRRTPIGGANRDGSRFRDVRQHVVRPRKYTSESCRSKTATTSVRSFVLLDAGVRRARTVARTGAQRRRGEVSSHTLQACRRHLTTAADEQ